jgi:hypothetical protein
MALPFVMAVLFSSREVMRPRALAQLMAGSRSIALARRILLSRRIRSAPTFNIADKGRIEF